MPGRRVVLLTSVAMLAFAGNSLLCRLALKETAIDAASFTTVRIVMWFSSTLSSGSKRAVALRAISDDLGTGLSDVVKLQLTYTYMKTTFEDEEAALAAMLPGDNKAQFIQLGFQIQQ